MDHFQLTRRTVVHEDGVLALFVTGSDFEAFAGGAFNGPESSSPNQMVGPSSFTIAVDMSNCYFRINTKSK